MEEIIITISIRAGTQPEICLAALRAAGFAGTLRAGLIEGSWLLDVPCREDDYAPVLACCSDFMPGEG